ncbi:MAG: hypothetical protein INR65_12200, partial [Gluconacetobacter diazotrophicus]|nr:hypothetical protein [Gluconacetobacter diazotrophicus]
MDSLSAIAPRPGSEPGPASHAAGARGHRHNNFDALRLFAAIIVIYGHGWGMTTSTSPPWWGNGPIAR